MNGKSEDITVWAARALAEIHRRDLPRITWTLAAAQRTVRLRGQAITREQVEAYADLLGVCPETHDQGKRLTARGTFRGVPVHVTFYQRAEVST